MESEKFKAMQDKALEQLRSGKSLTGKKEWQFRPLENMHTIVWLDAMHYKSKRRWQGRQQSSVQCLGYRQERI